jgi:type III secretion protein Q
MTPAIASRPPSLQPPPLSRDLLAARNVVCRSRRAIDAEWRNDDWQVNLLPHPPETRPAWHLTCDWGGARVVVSFSEYAAGQIASVLLDETAVAQYGDELLLAALESALDAISSSIEESTRKHFALVGISRDAPDRDGLERHGWQARCDDITIEGDLMLDIDGARFLAAALREHPIEPSDASWDALPVRIRLLIGWVDLHAPAISALEAGDVVVLDECLYSQGSHLLMQLAPSLAIECRLEGHELHVIQGVHEIMSEPEHAPESSGALDGIPVRLTFDLGEREMTLGDLRTLQPGYVFNLGRDPRSSVCIRANGSVIGDGELVDIEGRIGVSVLRVSAPQ